MNEPNSCALISVDCFDTLNNIAFDGCAYFCTIKCKREIVMLNECFKVQKKFCTSREYDCICYDWCDQCFWASSNRCYNKLYKLDCCMNEIDCITICDLDVSGVITGISLKCCDDTLVVSFACAIVEVQKHSESSKLLHWSKKGWILGVLSLCPGILTIVLRDGKYYVEVFDDCCNKVKRYCAGHNTTPKGLIFNPCKCSTKSFGIDVFLLKKHSYPYICSYAICAEDLGFIPQCCNYVICETCCDNNHCYHQDTCADMMESIALIETALSHILNAEGEKIQKVLAETNDFEKILSVNREVNKTIINATHLEHVLYAKLSALSDCGCDCNSCNKKCDCDDNCCDCDCDCCCDCDCDCNADDEIF